MAIRSILRKSGLNNPKLTATFPDLLQLEPSSFEENLNLGRGALDTVMRCQHDHVQLVERAHVLAVVGREGCRCGCELWMAGRGVHYLIANQNPGVAGHGLPHPSENLDAVLV